MSFYKTRKDVTVWKKIRNKNGKQYICQMLIEKGTTCYCDYFSQKKTDKNRAEKACVIAIYNLSKSHYLSSSFHYHWDAKDTVLVKRVKHVSSWDDLIYKVGEEVFPDKFSRSTNQCSPGIHFYYDVDRALNW